MAGGVLLSAWAVGVEPLLLRVTRTPVPLEGLPGALEGLRVGVLCDLHAGGWVGERLVERAVAALEAEDPEVVLLAGDMVTSGSGPRALDDLGPLGRLRPPLGKFAVLGGHDHKYGAAQVGQRLEALGFAVLCNEGRPLRREGATLWLAGVDDNSWRAGRDDLAGACRGVSDGEPVLALAHSPDLLLDPGRERVALIVAGHTHGGQVRLPLVGPVYRVTDVPLRYAAGLSRHGSTWLYVSRGVGSTYRLRLLCRPEVSLLVLRRAAG